MFNLPVQNVLRSWNLTPNVWPLARILPKFAQVQLAIWSFVPIASLRLMIDWRGILLCILTWSEYANI
jgi:hypothetical protein